MTPIMGLNLRVSGHCGQGGRKYMEDAFVVAYQQTEDQKDLEYAYFGIFDGHGGREAALFAKEHLMNNIVSQKSFWSDDDSQVLKAIRDGFLATHQAMWKEVENWPKTASGLPSTSGTTSSVAFIKRRKLFIGHVGDSKIVLGYQLPDPGEWCAQELTKDHKPESPEERRRINSVGGLVLNKAGVERVVWNRPQPGHKGPILRNTPVDKIPFLAVARSLGDLWSYNYSKDKFVVSPDPDVNVVEINPRIHRCVIFASDGLWNMLSPLTAVRKVQKAEEENDKIILEGNKTNGSAKPLKADPSRLLVEAALSRWFSLGMRADNTSVVTVMLDPPGPPKSEVLLKAKVMKRLRPRDEQNEVKDEGTKNPSASESTSKGKKRPFESVEHTANKEKKLLKLLESSKDKKLIPEDDLMPKNLPKPVILSPCGERKTKKEKCSLVENKVSPEPDKSVTREAPSFSENTASSLKKRTHDSSNGCFSPLKVAKNENKVTSPESASDDVGKCGESSEPTSLQCAKEKSCPLLLKNESASKFDKSEELCQTNSTTSKENGRVHLCEVDNFFKLNNNSESRSPELKKNVSPKVKNFRKSSPLNRNKSTHLRSTSSLRKSRIVKPVTSVCRTRAQSNIQKLKV